MTRPKSYQKLLLTERNYLNKTSSSNYKQLQVLYTIQVRQSQFGNAKQMEFADSV